MKRLVLGFFIAVVLVAPLVAQGQRTTWPSSAMLAAQTSTGSSTPVHPVYWVQTYHATGFTTAAAGAATIIIEVSNLESPATATTVDWVTACTITLTLATTQTGEGCVIAAPWRTVRARLSVLSGTGASVSVRMGS